MPGKIDVQLLARRGHHFLDDGYLPSWIPMAGAIAARTRRVRLSSDVCLLPFNHPVRLAEDLVSNGRIEVGVGTGYAPRVFRGFGLPVSRRVSLTDEASRCCAIASPA